MGDIALKACPFCKGAEEWGRDYGRRVISPSSDDGRWRIQCCNCDARGPLADEGEEEAAELWNRRTTTTEKG